MDCSSQQDGEPDHEVLQGEGFEDRGTSTPLQLCCVGLPAIPSSSGSVESVPGGIRMSVGMHCVPARVRVYVWGGDHMVLIWGSIVLYICR